MNTHPGGGVKANLVDQREKLLAQVSGDRGADLLHPDPADGEEETTHFSK